MSDGFTTEQDLFDCAINSSYVRNLLLSSARFTTYFVEPRGLFGIPDLVIAQASPLRNGKYQVHAIAFEMKLSNWKRAIIQAYRYRTFTHESYVLIDYKFVHRALNKIELFQRSNIGLLSIDKQGIVLTHHQPSSTPPLSRHASARFVPMVEQRILA